MNLKALSEELSYLTCKKHYEQLSIVCLQKACKKNTLICPICESNDHNGHNVTSLRNFINQIKTLNDEQAVKMALQLQLHISKTKDDFKCEIIKVREQFDQCLYELETRVDQYFNNLDQRCYDSFRKRKEQYMVDVIKSSTSNDAVKRLSTFLHQMKQYDSISLNNELNFYRNSTIKKLNSFTHTIKKLNFKTQFSHASKLFKNLPNSFNLLRYTWSSSKASTIQINGMKATQKSSNSSGERFALLNQQNGSTRDIKINFKINKLKGWVGIGICFRQAIINAGFKFNYTQTFHGSYLISANGYSWSHSKPEFNSAYKSFLFHEGDIIEVNYSVTDATVSFENKKNSSKFVLSTAPMDSNDYYVPCVNLCNPGDEVQIINEIQ